MSEPTDPLTWLWGKVDEWKSTANYLFSNANQNRNFSRPLDHVRHDSACGMQTSPAPSTCSCCKGALTFEEARFVKTTLSEVPEVHDTRTRTIQRIPANTAWGIDNGESALKHTFGVGDGEDGSSTNYVFGDNGIITRTLEVWNDTIEKALELIKTLREELLKARAETKRAEERETVAKLTLEQEMERLRKAQETLNETAKDRAGRAREAFGTAENTFDLQSAQKHVETLLRSLPMNKSLMERLRDLKSRPNRPCLTRSRPKDSRVCRRAAREPERAARRSGTKKKQGSHRQRRNPSRYVHEAPRKNAASFEHVCRCGWPRPPLESTVSAGVGQEGAQRLQGKGA